MRDTFHDLETYSERPLKNGSYQYAESAEVMVWSWADGNGQIYVWDLVNNTLNYEDDLSGAWVEEALDYGPYATPEQLGRIILDDDALVWFRNAGQFDFPVLDRALPEIGRLIPMARRRDTMVQAFAHALPGALEKLGEILNINETKRKIKEGKRLVRLFCMPQSDAFFEKHGTRRATKQTHPADWQAFLQYAGGDIMTMREARRLMPSWNYTGKQVELCHIDWTINNRGFLVDLDLAHGAVRAAEATRARLATRTQEITDDEVQSTTQRDVLLQHILEIHGVELPNLQADTLERRIADPDLPEAVRELIGIRLQASMNSVAKYKTLLKGVSGDGRLRGTMQFRGAGRTGRWAHRMFQGGNLPRPTMPQELIDLGIEYVKTDQLDAIELGLGNPMTVISNGIRGAIIAPPGRKLVIADLANIEGRMAAWLAGEEWKLQAFRDYDAGTGWDLYILAYAKSFNVEPSTVPKKGPERQIGKVEELMFQYGGGVGAWITGAATYGIDLDLMTEQVYPTLPDWAVGEAQGFLEWLYEQVDEKFKKRFEKIGFGPGYQELCVERDAAKGKARHNLPTRTFVACDAIKRLWRAAHPKISSYWKELEDTVRQAMTAPGVTFPCRKVKIRRDGAWLRIGLPSGRALCYPNPKIENGKITFTGLNQYTRQWGRVSTYGGKLFENITQAASCDQFAECMLAIEDDGYQLVLGIHDEHLAETPDEDRYNAAAMGALMCADLGWNEGLPLAAAGFETYRYRKE